MGSSVLFCNLSADLLISGQFVSSDVSADEWVVLFTVPSSVLVSLGLSDSSAPRVCSPASSSICGETSARYGGIQKSISLLLTVRVKGKLTVSTRNSIRESSFENKEISSRNSRRDLHDDIESSMLE